MSDNVIDPLHPCGHPIGAGIHTTSEEVDACAAQTLDNARKVRAQHDAMQRPDYRGGAIAVSAHGLGVGARAEIVLLRSVPGRLDRQEAQTWTVRYFSESLRPSWGITTRTPDDARDYVLQAGIATFETALDQAMADAGAELRIILTEVDRRGVEEGS